ncbi:DUF4328 domain-containing protein [Sinosporangium album]|uniref:DUF4328 domain-containing protein n=1 Tax=Sinosporangium album TaxID=504805 RepID=UPI001FE0E533|nr:DUF4328 domain-containing protein [Sinosporangium album]
MSLTALVVFEQVRGRELAQQINALGGDLRSAPAQTLLGAMTVFAVLMLAVAVTTLGAMATYLTWLVRARQANNPLAPAAGATIAAWAVPMVNLVAPPVLLDRVWRGARPSQDRRARWLVLVAAWWMTLLAALTLTFVRLPLLPASGSIGLTGLGPVEVAVTALAALLCAVTVREVTGIQTRGSKRRTAVRKVRVVPLPAPVPSAEQRGLAATTPQRSP